ncbi:MAG: tRNA (N6-isopentenyl adenosine(37)-C2)-methylthiotransferase MiaB [Candidatus Brocadiia bacterium]
MSVCVVPFGCQMNRADASAIMELLAAEGHSIVSDEDGADAVVYVTCTVRQHAEDRAISRLGRLARRKRDGIRQILVLAGCVAEKEAAHAFETIPGLDIVCGTRSFQLLPSLLEEASQGQTHLVAVGLDSLPDAVSGLHWRTSHFQAFVTIMRGCDNFCSYCVVPHVRGRECSRPPAEILDEIRALAAQGVIEVTLLGQNVNSYGKGLGGDASLSSLLASASEIPGIRRLKFVTSHPKDLTDQLIAALALPKVCPYLHLPAQSGSSAVLASMNRRYTREHYLDLVRKVRERVPNIGLASDFIVGYPGETDPDFADTVSMVKEVRFQQVFVFKYSPRPGTAAARMPDDVPPEVKAARNNELLSIHMKIAAEDNHRMIGRTLEVLVEGPSPRNAARLIGRSPQERIVIVDGDASLAGRIIPVRITNSTALALYGTPEEL